MAKAKSKSTPKKKMTKSQKSKAIKAGLRRRKALLAAGIPAALLGVAGTVYAVKTMNEKRAMKAKEDEVFQTYRNLKGDNEKRLKIHKELMRDLGSHHRQKSYERLKRDNNALQQSNIILKQTLVEQSRLMTELLGKK